MSEFLPFFIQKSTVHHSLVQSWFQFILKVLARIEVRALCRPITFFYTKLIQLWMLLCALEHAGAENGLSQTVKDGSIELSKMSEALKRASAQLQKNNPIKDVPTPSPPNFTVRQVKFFLALHAG